MGNKLDNKTWISLYLCLCPYERYESVLPTVVGKFWGRLGSLAFVWQPIYEKENSEFKPAKLCMEIDLMSHPAHGRIGWVNTFIQTYK